MFRGGWRALTMSWVVMVFGSMWGCQYEQLQQQNEALWSQNKELQDELARSRLAMDALESERDGWLQQNQVSARSSSDVFMDGAAANTGTGFTEIEGVEAIQTADRVTVRVPGDVLFSPGKAMLRRQAKKTLSEIADVLKRDYASNTVLISGHTDTDPIKKSKWTDNLELSLQRAAAVHRYLQQQGADPSRMHAVGRGAWHPQSTKKKSRRVEIEVALD